MFKRTFIATLALLLAQGAWADRIITDQLNRQVRLPDHVQRAVILQHQTLNIAVQLNATGQIAGVLSDWEKLLGKGYDRLAPELTALPKLGSLNTVNVEELLALKPDVVFVTNYFPKEEMEKISQAGLPVVAISLRKGDSSEAAKLNPTLENEDESYSEGLKEGIAIIAEVFEKQAQGKALSQAAFAHRPLVAARLKSVKEAARVKTYIANPNLETYGSGKYTGLMMQHAGAYNVAAASVKGFQKVSMESVLGWQPEVIFVQNRYPQVVDEIRGAAEWQSVPAVKNQRVYLMPEYAKAWGYPMPEAIALGEVWVAKKLYPEQFKDVDLDKMVSDYYRQFYRTSYQNNQP